MSSVSWSEPRLLVWEQGGFSRGSHVAREHAWHLSVIDTVTLTTQERWWPSLDADAAANYPSSSGQIEWLSVKSRGQLSQRQRAISAIALDKR